MSQTFKTRIVARLGECQGRFRFNLFQVQIRVHLGGDLLVGHYHVVSTTNRITSTSITDGATARCSKEKVDSGSKRWSTTNGWVMMKRMSVTDERVDTTTTENDDNNDEK